MIIQRHYPALAQKGKALFDCFWHLWSMNNGDKPPAPRDSLKIFNLAQNLADYEVVKYTCPIILEHHGEPAFLKVKHIEEAFESFFDGHGRSG